ncbi:MAG: glycolate oxidase subunit GlcF [Gammaproteobacteria bacterium]|jgi:glycolate oxidase iron-sulfur subunit
MQTALPKDLLNTTTGQVADEILRNCVHCGFCNATCPTYQLTGDELDGPRGRIYQIKQVLEGKTPTERNRLHLDRCLTCRACETTCPSGVDYHLLLDTGREIIEKRLPRRLSERMLRRALRLVLPWPARFTPLLRAGQLVRPLLPAAFRQRIPARHRAAPVSTSINHARTMLLLDGCVQPALAPQINAATRRVLDALGINTRVAKNAGCCGALSQHLSATDEAQAFIRNNIDAWWPAIEQGAEAIIVTASGCAPMVKDYGRLLAETDYADKAARVSALARDISEVIDIDTAEQVLGHSDSGQKVAFHSPCTLQHGQGINGVVERLLTRLGYVLTPVMDSHLCCGSAGTYSILQPGMAGVLRDNKLEALQGGKPDLIATANIGCLMHMENHAMVPVKHWIELLETLIPNTGKKS